MGDGREKQSFADSERGKRLVYWRLTRAPVVLLLGWWTLSMVFLRTDWIFLDNVNLLLHEAGHFFFGWAPRSLHVFGGTLGQLAWPVIFAVYFWWKRSDLFAALACTWWFGENLRNIARYLADAAFEVLPITGEIHDWAFLARRFGFLSSAQEIGGVIRFFGALFMIGAVGALLWMTLRPDRRALDDSLAAD